MLFSLWIILAWFSTADLDAVVNNFDDFFSAIENIGWSLGLRMPIYYSTFLIIPALLFALIMGIRLSLSVYSPNSFRQILNALQFLLTMLPLSILVGCIYSLANMSADGPFKALGDIESSDVVLFWVDQLLRGAAGDFFEVFDIEFSGLTVNGNEIQFLIFVTLFRFFIAGGFIVGLLKIFGRELIFVGDRPVSERFSD